MKDITWKIIQYCFPQIDRHFELLNYSEYGSKVDGVTYSCDFNDKPATTPKVSPLVASVREVVKKKKGKKGAKEAEIKEPSAEEKHKDNSKK